MEFWQIFLICTLGSLVGRLIFAACSKPSHPKLDLYGHPIERSSTEANRHRSE